MMCRIGRSRKLLSTSAFVLVDNSLLDLHNSSYHTQPYGIIAKHFYQEPSRWYMAPPHLASGTGSEHHASQIHREFEVSARSIISCHLQRDYYFLRGEKDWE